MGCNKNMDYNTKEDKVRKLLRAYMIFLFQSKKINIVDLDWDEEFCQKYRNAIKEVFEEEPKLVSKLI
jgi:hypothetical protein